MKFIDFLDIYLTGIENIFPQTRVAKSIGEKNRNVWINLNLFDISDWIYSNIAVFFSYTFGNPSLGEDVFYSS